MPTFSQQDKSRLKLKSIIPFLFLAITPGLCFSQNAGTANWSFSAGSGLEVLHGTAYEYVYDNSNGNKMSELDWGIQPIISLAAIARARYRKAELDVSCTAGFPGDSGTMTDSDWLNESVGDTSTRTNYSESEALAEYLVDLCISFNYEFDPAATLALKPFVGFRYLNITWSATGGWFQYASNYQQNSNPPYYSYTTGQVSYFDGCIATYEQTYSAIVVGLEADWRLTNRFSIDASFQASPAVSCTGTDSHKLRGLTYTDTMSGGYLLEPDIALDWSLSSMVDLRFHCKYTLISGLKGTDTETADANVDSNEGLSPGQSVVYPNTAGAAFSTFGFGIIAELHI
jgi:outer membrane protease